MISSTRSSESASRSSWNDASSVMSASSIPSCSVRTSLTRSKTSSRDAAMSPHLMGARKNRDAAKSRRSYNLSLLGQPCTEAADDAVLHAAGGQPDRIRDRGAGRVAVRDHRQATQTEEIRAAVGVGIEAVAEAPGGRADEQAAELPRRGGGDLGAKRVEEGADRALEGLENDVAGETVGDDDGVGAAEDVAALRVAAEVQVACGGEVVRLARQPVV